MSSTARKIGAIGLLCGAVGCAAHTPGASAGASPAPAPGGASSAAPVAASPVRFLIELPPRATYAWVRPRRLQSDATAEDDASYNSKDAVSIRLDVDAVLKGEGWAVVDPDSAQYTATIALVGSTRVVQELREVQHTDPPPVRCDATRTGTGARPACTGTAPSVSRTASVAKMVTDEQVMFMIRRRADGASHVRSMPFVNATSAGGIFAKDVIFLLKSGARD